MNKSKITYTNFTGSVQSGNDVCMVVGGWWKQDNTEDQLFKITVCLKRLT